MHNHFRLSGILVLTIVFCTGVAGAISITLHPTDIEPGERIFVEIRDLPDGSDFELLAEGIYPPSGENLTFQLTGFEIPFSLVNGEILVNVVNAGHAAFRVKRGDTIATMEAYPPDGIFSRREARNISSGTYAYFRLDATPYSPYRPVTSVMHLRGLKQGPENATISFSLEGIQAGQVRIKILADGTGYMDELITIGSGGDSTGTGMASPDGRAWLTGASDSSARLLILKPAGVPEGWKAVTLSYRIVSSSTDLGNNTLLTIILPETIDPAQDVIFIAGVQDGSWEILPSRIREGDGVAVITAPVRQPGEYCLMAREVPETEVTSTRTPLPILPLLAALLLGGLAAGRRK